MKKNKAFNMALAATLAASAVVVAAPTQADAATLSFKDVSKTHQFYNDIMQLVERGIVKGYPNGNFGPYEAVKRGHAAKILAGLLGLDTTNVKNPNFKDVPTTNPYYGAIAALQNAGIINGKDDGTYGVNDSLTRGQMAKILTLGFKLQGEATTNPFKDIEGSGFKNNILTLLENGVTVGTSPTTFAPNSAVTRGQLAAFVLRAEKATQSEETPGETTKDTVTGEVKGIENGFVTVGTEQIEISSELEKVFSEANAAALEDATVELVVEYKPEAVASITPMPIAKKGKGKVVGVKKVKLVKANTTFNPQNFEIPTVELSAQGVTLTNLNSQELVIANSVAVTLVNSKLNTLTVATGAQVTLNGAEVTELKVTGDAKVTIGEGTKLGKIVLEEGKKLEDIIANFDQVEAVLKDITVVIGDKETTVDPVKPVNPGGSGSAGGSGSVGGSVNSLDGIVDKMISAAEGKFGTDSYAEVAVDTASNVLKFKVIKENTELWQVKQDMKNSESKINSILTDEESDDFISKFASIASEGKTYNAQQLLIGQLLDKNFAKEIILGFVDPKQGTKTTIGELKGQSTTITVNFKDGSSVNYTLSIEE